MFYGGGTSRGGDREKDIPKGRLERFDQMSKQQQLIEQKKREIEIKLQSERHKREMEAVLGKQKISPAAGAVNSSANAGLSIAANKSSSTVKSEPKGTGDVKSAATLVFANDGSFLEQFKKLQGQKLKEEAEAKKKTTGKEEQDFNEYGMLSGKKSHIKIMNIPQQPRKSLTPPATNGTSEIENRNTGYSSCNIVPASYGVVPPPPPPQTVSYHLPRPQEDSVSFPSSPAASHVNQFGSTMKNTTYLAPSFNQDQQRREASAGFPSQIVKNFAAIVAEKGEQHENVARLSSNPVLWFLNRPDSEEYRLYRDLVMKLRAEKLNTAEQDSSVTAIAHAHPSNYDQYKTCSQSNFESTVSSITPSVSGTKRELEDDEFPNSGKKRRSRWGPQEVNSPPVVGTPLTVPPHPGMGFRQNLTLSEPPQSEYDSRSVPQNTQVANIPGISAADWIGPAPILTASTRTNPQLLDYARQSYGTTQLDEEQWKQCEEAYKMNLLFQDIARKKAKDEELNQAGKFKYEYDSDEEIDETGTWEHKKRLEEMEKTRQWANELTVQAKGKHHIGDFLPPEELEKFMNKYKAVKDGQQMTQTAYEDFKIAQDNVGFKLLQKMGWVDGQGLGATSQGITTPIDKGTTGSEKHGLGLEHPDEMREDDDEYSAYRKRMMLAYRFRPNPLNNPRRAYY